ncbi:MAG: hypothetical protein DMF63_16710 [Acidobacteria bacterium]|nr:MAG: hypothetical protein DMF63_16710 [Acidobacteriota bacterium]
MLADRAFRHFMPIRISSFVPLGGSRCDRTQAEEEPTSRIHRFPEARDFFHRLLIFSHFESRRVP